MVEIVADLCPDDKASSLSVAEFVGGENEEAADWNRDLLVFFFYVLFSAPLRLCG
jgi:hypothetical protein